MNDIEFAKYTHKIKTMLPYWFKMKKQPHDSMGLQFLNTIGIQLDDIEKILDYAYKQTNINEADINFTDIIYKAIIPTIYNINTIKDIRVNDTAIFETKSLYKFFGLDYTYGVNNVINSTDYYFFDREKKVIYVNEAYDKDNTFLDGKIYIDFNNETTTTIPLVIHHVWNFFDEFGALLGCKRLYGEKNYYYKNRILDVFKNPAGSSKFPLANGISRELGLRKYKIWSDPKKEFVIKDKMVIVNTITKNNTPVDISSISINSNGELVISPDRFEAKRDCEITYIAGLELNSLSGSKSNKFSNELYMADGTPTELLLDYVECIKENSSILWNDFIYDETMWVKDNDEFGISHYAFVPSKLDASTKGFAKFGFSKTNTQ